MRIQPAQAKKKTKRARTNSIVDGDIPKSPKDESSEDVETLRVPLEPNEDPSIELQLKPLNTDECLERLSLLQNMLDLQMKVDGGIDGCGELGGGGGDKGGGGALGRGGIRGLDVSEQKSENRSPIAATSCPINE